MATKTESNAMDLKDDTRICKDCKMSFPNIYAYAEHLESKQHIKGAMKQKYGKKYLEAKAKLEGKNLEEKTETLDNVLRASEENSKQVLEVPKIVENVKSSVDSSAKDNSDKDDDIDDDAVYTCEVCKKVCTGLMNYQLHMQGKKHQKNEKKIFLLKQMKEEKLLQETKDEPKEESLLDRLFPQARHVSPNLECTACKKKCMGPEAYKQHCNSESHKKKFAMEELWKSMEAEGLSPVKDHDNDDEPFAHCDICNKDFTGPLPYMQHMKSNTHIKQELRMNQFGKIQNLIFNEEENSKFKCKECSKMFSGPIPFNAHLKSAAHDKMKKKSALIDNLEKKHPELLKTLAVENSDDSEEDDGVILGCKVCHVVFSGPEAANDHFKSSKHKKNVQKKTMFKKFKQQQKAGKLPAIPDSIKKDNKSDSEDGSDFEKEFDIIEEK